MRLKDIELNEKLTFGDAVVSAAYLIKDANNKIVLHLTLDDTPVVEKMVHKNYFGNTTFFYGVNDGYAEYFMRRHNDPEHNGEDYDYSSRASVINRVFGSDPMHDCDIMEIECDANIVGITRKADATLDFIYNILPPDYTIVLVYDQEPTYKIVHVELSDNDVKNFVEYYRPMDW